MPAEFMAPLALNKTNVEQSIKPTKRSGRAVSVQDDFHADWDRCWPPLADLDGKG